MNVITVNNRRLEFFRRKDGWNWRSYYIFTARTCPYIDPEARYPSRQAAQEAATEWARKQNPDG